MVEQEKEEKKKKSRDLGLEIGLPVSDIAAGAAMVAWEAIKSGPEILRIRSNMARAGTETIHRTKELVKGAKTWVEQTLRLTERYGRVTQSAMTSLHSTVHLGG